MTLGVTSWNQSGGQKTPTTNYKLFLNMISLLSAIFMQKIVIIHILQQKQYKNLYHGDQFGFGLFLEEVPPDSFWPPTDSYSAENFHLETLKTF